MRGVAGFRFAGLSAGLKASGKKDLGLILADAPVVVAGSFTRSRAAAAPVIVCRRRLRNGSCVGVVVNSGNANACTGAKGMEDALRTTKSLASELGVKSSQLMVCSTGVIGAPLPMERLLTGVGKLQGSLSNDPTDFADSILTTDTCRKMVRVSAVVGGKTVTVLGVAKGSGMIMPNMATMLAFLCTDAVVDAKSLSRICKRSVEASFNAITVDGETSTNDTAMVFASGLAGNKDDEEGLALLIEKAMVWLAKAIVEDGEGAHHLVELRVKGGMSSKQADQVARKIANSPLVKTALHGQDPNWGRIVSAAATAGEKVDPERFDLRIAGVPILKAGKWCGPDAEARARKGMARSKYAIELDLKLGTAERRMWTCDLSADYVRINANYRS